MSNSHQLQGQCIESKGDKTTFTIMPLRAESSAVTAVFTSISQAAVTEEEHMKQPLSSVDSHISNLVGKINYKLTQHVTNQ